MSESVGQYFRNLRNRTCRIRAIAKRAIDNAARLGRSLHHRQGADGIPISRLSQPFCYLQKTPIVEARLPRQRQPLGDGCNTVSCIDDYDRTLIHLPAFLMRPDAASGRAHRTRSCRETGGPAVMRAELAALG